MFLRLDFLWVISEASECLAVAVGADVDQMRRETVEVSSPITTQCCALPSRHRPPPVIHQTVQPNVSIIHPLSFLCQHVLIDITIFHGAFIMNLLDFSRNSFGFFRVFSSDLAFQARLPRNVSRLEFQSCSLSCSLLSFHSLILSASYLCCTFINAECM